MHAASYGPVEFIVSQPGRQRKPQPTAGFRPRIDTGEGRMSCAVAELAAEWAMLDDHVAALWMTEDGPSPLLLDERRLTIEAQAVKLTPQSVAGAMFIAWLVGLHASIANDEDAAVEVGLFERRRSGVRRQPRELVQRRRDDLACKRGIHALSLLQGPKFCQRANAAKSF